MARRLVSVKIKGDPTNAELQVEKREIQGRRPDRYLLIHPDHTSLLDDALAKGRPLENDGTVRIPIE